MKLSEAIKLGHQNISGYKRRSFSAILTAGIMFGVLLGILMVVQGLENVLLCANDASFSSSPYYIFASTNFLQCESETILDEDGKFAGIDTTCPEFDNDLLKSDVAKFHGEVLDNLSTEERLNLITSIIKTPIDIENIPADTVPILVSVASALNYAGLYPPQHLNIADQLVIALQVAQPSSAKSSSTTVLNSTTPGFSPPGNSVLLAANIIADTGRKVITRSTLF